MILTENFTFHDKNAIVIIEKNIVGLGKKVSIIAQMMIMSPHAQLMVSKLDIQTEGAALLLNVKADVVRFIAQGNAVLGNSDITFAKVHSEKNATVFGMNAPSPIPLSKHYAAIISVLEDVIPLEVRNFLPIASESSVALLPAPEAYDVGRSSRSNSL